MTVSADGRGHSVLSMLCQHNAADAFQASSFFASKAPDTAVGIQDASVLLLLVFQRQQVAIDIREKITVCLDDILSVKNLSAQVFPKVDGYGCNTFHGAY